MGNLIHEHIYRWSADTTHCKSAKNPCYTLRNEFGLPWKQDNCWIQWHNGKISFRSVIRSKEESSTFSTSKLVGYSRAGVPICARDLFQKLHLGFLIGYKILLRPGEANFIPNSVYTLGTEANFRLKQSKALSTQPEKNYLCTEWLAQEWKTKSSCGKDGLSQEIGILIFMPIHVGTTLFFSCLVHP